MYEWLIEVVGYWGSNSGYEARRGWARDAELSGWAENAVAKRSKPSGGPDHLVLSACGGLCGILKLLVSS